VYCSQLPISVHDRRLNK